MTEQTHAGMSGSGKELFVQESRRVRTPHGKGALHPLRWLLIFVFVLKMAGAAEAGSYTVTYSGGSYTVDGTTWDDGTYGAGGYWQHGGGSKSASCQGAITATYTWQPAYDGEPAPGSVIVVETCGSIATAITTTASATYSASADNGFGDSPTSTLTQGSPGAKLVAQVTGTHYSVKSSPGTSFTTQGTPTSTATVSAGSVSAAAGYSVSTIVPVLSLAGTTPTSATDKSKNILIGQGCQGTFTAPGVTLKNYQWSVVGDTFKSYVASSLSERSS